MPEAPKPLVVVDRVGKSFGTNRVLKDVSLTVGKGEVVTLIGPSGCGKTTLLRCVNFLETYDSGVIAIDGETVGIRIGPDGSRRARPDREIAALRARVGMVFQSYNLFPHLTVLDNITAAPVKVRGVPLKQAREKAMALLERVGLADKAKQFPAALSGGQQQRVAIARTLAMEPSLILLDEVTSALDPELVGEVLDVVQSLAAEGMTMMIVTHEMQFARDVSSRVAFMAAGEIIELAPPDQLFGNPASDRLRAFLGRYRAAHRI
jgi:polar amino acid transport system ATP-binding protein